MKNKVSGFILSNKAAIILLVLAAGMSLVTPVFLTQTNLVNVIRQTSTSAILACGYCMILGAGYIDLSVGSQIGMMGALMALLMRAGAPTIVAILAAMVFGMLLGCMNAFIITTFERPAFIVTLASQQIVRGAVYLITGMVPILDMNESYVWLGQGRILSIPVPIYILAVVFIIVLLIMNRFKFGRHILAVGGNAQAAYVSGIHTKAVVYKVYMAMGGLYCHCGDGAYGKIGVCPALGRFEHGDGRHRRSRRRRDEHGRRCRECARRPLRKLDRRRCQQCDEPLKAGFQLAVGCKGRIDFVCGYPG